MCDDVCSGEMQKNFLLQLLTQMDSRTDKLPENEGEIDATEGKFLKHAVPVRGRDARRASRSASFQV